MGSRQRYERVRSRPPDITSYDASMHTSPNCSLTSMATTQVAADDTDDHDAMAYKLPPALRMVAQDVEELDDAPLPLLLVCQILAVTKEHDCCRVMPFSDHLFILFRPGTSSKIAFCIHNDAFFALKGVFEERIARREWDTVVATLDDQVNRGKQSFHLLQPSLVVAQEVRPGQRWYRREGMTGDE